MTIGFSHSLLAGHEGGSGINESMLAARCLCWPCRVRLCEQSSRRNGENESEQVIKGRPRQHCASTFKINCTHLHVGIPINFPSLAHLPVLRSTTGTIVAVCGIHVHASMQPFGPHLASFSCSLGCVLAFRQSSDLQFFRNVKHAHCYIFFRCSDAVTHPCKTSGRRGNIIYALVSALFTYYHIHVQ